MLDFARVRRGMFGHSEEMDVAQTCNTFVDQQIRRGGFDLAGSWRQHVEGVQAALRGKGTGSASRCGSGPDEAQGILADQSGAGQPGSENPAAQNSLRPRFQRLT